MDKLKVYVEAVKIIETKKIITPALKTKLVELGFREVVIGTKEIHEIQSKEVKIDFHGYNIAIGLSARAISYNSGRQYRAMAIKFVE